MKKMLILSFCIICLIYLENVNAEDNTTNTMDTLARRGWEEIDYLRTLSPELQVHIIITRYKYSGGLTNNFYSSVGEVLIENPEAVKPVLFEYARNTYPLYIRDTSDMTFHLIFTIINRFFLVRNDFFTPDEKLLLAEIYKEKLDYYLRIYRVLDDIVYNLEYLIIRLSTGVNIGENPSYRYTLLQKFKDLGYGDLQNILYYE